MKVERIEAKLNKSGHGPILLNGEPIENAGGIVIEITPNDLTKVTVTFVGVEVDLEHEGFFTNEKPKG